MDLSKHVPWYYIYKGMQQIFATALSKTQTRASPTALFFFFLQDLKFFFALLYVFVIKESHAYDITCGKYK